MGLRIVDQRGAEALNKFISIISKRDHVTVELVEDVLGRESVRQRFVYRAFEAAHAAARTLSRQNGGCGISEFNWHDNQRGLPSNSTFNWLSRRWPRPTALVHGAAVHDPR
jgi:hypothetical protein